MKADPSAATFKVDDTIISDPINIASIALGPRIHTSDDRITVNQDREVFFSPLSSLHLYSVNTTILKNEMNAMNDGEYQGELKNYGLKASQSVGMIMDNEGMLYYSLLATYSIARWDIRTSFQTGQKIIARDENFLEWPNSFTFDQTGNITVLVNKLNKFIYDNLNVNEVNFRLITAHVGGKSYLYDQNYDYTVEQSTTTTTTAKLPEPHLMPGTDQDPYLVPSVDMVPKPEPEPTPEPEPKPEPTMREPTDMMINDGMAHDSTDHDHMNHDHMDHDRMDHAHTDHDHMGHDVSENPTAAANSETARKMEDDNKSGVDRLVGTFMGVLFAAALFVI